MDWITGFVSVAAMYLQGRKLWYGWLLALLNQVLWLYLALSRELWGLLPVIAAVTAMSAVNTVRWGREAREAARALSVGRQLEKFDKENEALLSQPRQCVWVPKDVELRLP